MQWWKAHYASKWLAAISSACLVKAATMCVHIEKLCLSLLQLSVAGWQAASGTSGKRHHGCAVGPTNGVQLADRHLVGGEGARLVRADDGSAAQCLH